MSKKISSQYLWKIVLLGSLLFFGGLGVEVEVVQYFGILMGILLLSLVRLQKGKIKFPPFIVIYSLFLILFLINSFFISVDTKKSLDVFSLFLGGGLFWVIAYNLREEPIFKFDKLIVLLGLFFAGLYFVNESFGNPFNVKPWSLYLPFSGFYNHNNIGDLWALVLTIIAFYLVKNPKSILHWIFVLIGTYLLVISQSRAALAALFIGVFYIAREKGLIEKNKKAFMIFVLTITIIFLYFGLQKTTLLTRPYYIQGILGILQNPQGVGVGNFRVISEDPSNHILGLSGFSSAAHNVVIEIVTGLGILGFVFVYWLTKVIQKLWVRKNLKNLVYKAVFFALTINFFFHASYFVPTMLWLWFISLGLSQD